MDKIKSLIVLIGKGNHNFTAKFITKKSAENFLIEMVVNKLKFFLTGNRETYWDASFDCEDDLIVWEEGKRRKYCAGWHWPEFQGKKEIEINGHSLYGLFSKLEDL